MLNVPKSPVNQMVRCTVLKKKKEQTSLHCCYIRLTFKKHNEKL